MNENTLEVISCTKGISLQQLKGQVIALQSLPPAFHYTQIMINHYTHHNYNIDEGRSMIMCKQKQAEKNITRQKDTIKQPSRPDFNKKENSTPEEDCQNHSEETHLHLQLTCKHDQKCQTQTNIKCIFYKKIELQKYKDSILIAERSHGTEELL